MLLKRLRKRRRKRQMKKTHAPNIVECDCKAKDIHPSCGCGNSTDEKVIVETKQPKCGTCNGACPCEEKVQHVKPKMVESLNETMKPKCGTCNGACPCEAATTVVATAPTVSTNVTS